MTQLGQCCRRQETGDRQLAGALSLILLAASLVTASSPAGLLRDGPAASAHTIRADDTLLQLARDGRFAWIVQLVEWREIEPTPGEYLWEYPDWLVRACEHYGLNLALRLDHPPEWAMPVDPSSGPVDVAAYAGFVARVAARYRGRVLAYIIWNEPNLASEWGGNEPNPAQYVELLRQASAAVKAADADALVVSAGLAPTNDASERAMDDRLFLRDMYAAGARGLFDVLGAHPYGFAYPPNDPPGAHNGLNFARLAELRQIMVEAGDAALPVWATEMGWTIDPVEPERMWHRVTDRQQASYLLAAFAQARREWPWLELLTVWNLSANLPSDDDRRGYSIVGDDGRPLPAYYALAYGLPPLPADARPGGQVSDVTILAPDVAVRLGDVDTFHPHWARLHCPQTPCRQWSGQFYVDDPGAGPWRLTMEIMQIDEPGNLVRINGHLLDPPAISLRGKPDFASVWTATEASVPPGVLRPGLNRIEVQLSPRLPVYHGDVARFESLQFRGLRLRPLAAERPPDRVASPAP